MPPQVSIVTKIKVQLKLSIARLRMIQQRDEATSKAQRRLMAQLLEAGKVESARIRVENIIRSDITTEVHEMLELYCELLLARAGLLDSPTCDPGLEEAAKSIVYAAPKTEVKELHAVRALLGERFGKDFVLAATTNSDGKVSDKVMRKLAVTPPREELVNGYLEEIARAYGVNWPPRKEPGEPPNLVDAEIDGLVDGGGKDENDDDDQGGGGGGGGGGRQQKNNTADDVEAGLSRATPPKTIGPGSPLRVNPPSPSTDNIHPRVTLNSMELKPSQKMVDAGLAKKPAAAGSKPSGDGLPELDEIAKRFAALKR
ncbi:hypothetical protein MAPG_01758 [Magnaporthiopsis poae ATCC 64411]|uniref:DUF292 domain-containing protein n=1 Tax=Magnaporthiopsis poae (strain ATCC 64411 / 73-15) TaxID=644358 RepID=A0A0C4DPJ1_MAGP6|nr:hypothetical protein MAPG_01758 [Magnaporthiopsis poae ATCC 64411]